MRKQTHYISYVVVGDWNIFSFRRQSPYQRPGQGSDWERGEFGLLQPGVQPALRHQVDRGRRGEAGRPGGGQFLEKRFV